MTTNRNYRIIDKELIIHTTRDESNKKYITKTKLVYENNKNYADEVLNESTEEINKMQDVMSYYEAVEKIFISKKQSDKKRNN